MAWAIDVKGLTKEYNGFKAVDSLDLQVPQGSVFGFLGPNGSGKTTTIRMLLGIIKATSGGGKILNLDMEKDSLKIRAQTGYMSELPEMYGYMTGEEIIKFCQGFYPYWDREMVDRYARLFHLSLKNKISSFSKGMKSQLALILALAPGPSLLILDEPTSGLDPIKRVQFLNIIIREIVTSGKTVFFSSHLLGDVERVCDQVAFIKEGRLIKTTSLDKLKTQEKIIRVVFQKEPPPDLLEKPGIKKVERDGKAYLIYVEENFDEIFAAYEKVSHFILEVIDQNLEELFIDYMGGGEDV
ncbi:MAG: ABC transporter ATP-binding protein [Candidatus Syntrophonatronum acetioxidans]|uniref:ABC transporter ATP-binding protein n=1 Tax=Candidatus Syntrophonatronum acetioxidans TaxID=1795816 RepID=A0A424YFE0_9FIRM|nr:MAG: ABC transporter ATP-binding protein [Candidatus Syntrophonatronum acetioxidans]